MLIPCRSTPRAPRTKATPSWPAVSRPETARRGRGSTDARRGAGRLRGRSGPPLPPAAPASAAKPLGLDPLSRCLERLPERERAVVVLSFYSERGSDEIAAELGLSPGNVRVVRHRALTRLRDCMGAPA